MATTTTKLRDLTYMAKLPDTTGWQARHLSALRAPSTSERPIVAAFAAWIEYARAHEVRFHSGIGDDGVLGPAWAQWGVALRTLLNGDCGRLDCGTLDGILYHNLINQGFDPDTL
jgi:hypothetical protein